MRFAAAVLQLVLIVVPLETVAAQMHDGHRTAPDTSATQADTASTSPEHHDRVAHTPSMRMMSSATSSGQPMNRDGSGTAWLPDAAPLDAVHVAAGEWSVMIHAAAFPRYTAQDAFDVGTRGREGFGAPNWAMGMAQRGLGSRGQLTARAMISLDPLTEGGDGYPLLFQSGETWEGERLVDRQHPHDFFSELSLTYAHRMFAGMNAFVYVAYPGEPAVGPVAFMHRPSARFNPDSPLGHHWQDATHILFGVATLGLTRGGFKIEQSFLTGSEPDEERFGFDEPTFDSYATRFSYNPSDHFALQVSRAFLEEPEVLEPGVDQVRTTASLLYSAPIGNDRDVSAAVVWGANDLRPDEDAEAHHGGGIQHALLAEAAVRVGRLALHGRAEYTQKSPEELALDAHEFGDEPFDVLAFTLGAGREVFTGGGLSAMLGAQGAVYAVPGRLTELYGEDPVSLQVYLRLAPSRMIHATMGQDGMQ